MKEERLEMKRPFFDTEFSNVITQVGGLVVGCRRHKQKIVGSNPDI